MAANYKYAVTVAGGIGPNVWDRDVEIEAPSLLEAVKKVEAELHGESLFGYKLHGDPAIVAAEQVD